MRKKKPNPNPITFTRAFRCQPGAHSREKETEESSPQPGSGCAQEFLPGATGRVTETVRLKAAGTLLAFGL